jgi:hypothetical protein
MRNTPRFIDDGRLGPESDQDTRKCDSVNNLPFEPNS